MYNKIMGWFTSVLGGAWLGILALKSYLGLEIIEPTMSWVMAIVVLILGLSLILERR